MVYKNGWVHEFQIKNKLTTGPGCAVAFKEAVELPDVDLEAIGASLGGESHTLGDNFSNDGGSGFNLGFTITSYGGAEYSGN